jgi:hypothetical protein
MEMCRRAFGISHLELILKVIPEWGERSQKLDPEAMEIPYHIHRASTTEYIESVSDPGHLLEDVG